MHPVGMMALRVMYFKNGSVVTGCLSYRTWVISSFVTCEKQKSWIAAKATIKSHREAACM
jgi:hypothetical protein